MRASLLTIAVAVSLASPVRAQTICHAEGDGPAFLDNVAEGGPNLLRAILFVAPASFACTRIEIFTGEKTGASTLGIWSHDAGGNHPGTDLGTAGWFVAITNQWQGADLVLPIPLVAGTQYWVVFAAVEGSQASLKYKGAPGQPSSYSLDGGQTWSRPFTDPNLEWKFRLYCNPCPNAFLPYGAGCVGTNGAMPTLAGLGCPAPLETIRIEAHAMLPGAAGVLILGSSNQIAAVTPSCLLQVAPCLPQLVSFTVLPSGSYTLTGALPSGTPIPYVLYLQAFTSDPGAPDGVAATNPLRMRAE